MQTADTTLSIRRLQRLRTMMQSDQIGALLVTGTANRRYLSGFTGSTGSLIITQEHALLLTTFIYRLQSAKEAPNFTVHEFSNKKPISQLIVEVAADYGIESLAFESQHMTVESHILLMKQLKDSHEEGRIPTLTSLHPVRNFVDPMRYVKDDEEIAILRRAIAITDAAIEAVLPQLRPDQTERQAVWMLECALREHGADATSFPIIVAAGPNAALPHAVPGDNLLGEGQPIVIDMGARVDGYHADLTRTITLGHADDRFHTIYDIVHSAQQSAIRDIRPGMTGGDADGLARRVIEEAGYGDAFGHSLGHGVGLEIHEGPTLGPGGKHIMNTGQVFSIEPGIYLGDWGGVRIEDLVLLHNDGCEVLSNATKETVIHSG